MSCRYQMRVAPNESNVTSVDTIGMARGSLPRLALVCSSHAVAGRVNRHQSHDRHAMPHDENILSGCRLVDQFREGGFGGVHTDNGGHVILDG
jgi:hypothetical protein